MKALLVSHSNGGGGAGRATQRLFEALDGVGVDLAMYADFKHGHDERVRTVSGPLAERRRQARIMAEEVPAFLARHPRPRLFSPGIASGITARTIDGSRADVVNVHWTGFGTISIRQLGRIRTPVVWTLHDMWAFTGGVGYDDEGPDARWRVGYTHGSRRRDGSRVDVERWVSDRKVRHWVHPMHLVTPSSWLKGLIQSSALLHDWPVEVIPNPVDTNVFAPRDPARARTRLGVSSDAHLVLVVLGSDMADPRKGFDLLTAALGTVEHGSPGLIQLAVAGHGGPPDDWPHGLPAVHWLGHLNDDEMVDAYAAADLVVVPSRQDNLPQTATEPQACGRPVIAFRVGGLPEIVDLGVTGDVVDPGDASALAAAITGLATDRERRTRMGAAARLRAERLWSPGTVGRAYRDLFAHASYR